MLMRGDFDLNTVQMHSDPVEVLAFNPQVHELHRLSSTRRSLTMVGNNEFDSYHSRNVKARSSCVPPKDATRYELLTKDARFSSITKEGSRSQKRSVNLQLSADDFIYRSGEDLQRTGNSFMTIEDLKLSLETRQRPTIPRFDNNRRMNNTVVIDLEDSLEKTRDDSARSGRIMRGIHGMSKSWFDRRNRNLNLSNAVVIDLEDPVEKVQFNYERRTTQLPDMPSSSSGKYLNDKVVINLENSLGGSSRGQWLASYKRENLDLNEAYQGDSCNPKPKSVHSSTLPEQDGNVCVGFGEMDGNVAKCTLLDLNIECEGMGFELEECDAKNGILECKKDASADNGNLVELNSTPMKPLLHDLNNIPLGDGDISCGTSEVDDQDRLSVETRTAASQDRNGNKSPASCKSCISDNDSSSIKRTQLFSSDYDPKNECLDNKPEEVPAKVDSVIRRAAVSLIYLGLDDSNPCYEDSKLRQPQYSLDSYEVMAMNLTQNLAEVEDSASSRAFEVDFVEDNKDQGSRWRRGRRLKDFQREILPCLASLSRHEIREDVNILEGVLRSREYRRMQAMAGGGQQSEVKRKRTRGKR